MNLWAPVFTLGCFSLYTSELGSVRANLATVLATVFRAPKTGQTFLVTHCWQTSFMETGQILAGCLYTPKRLLALYSFEEDFIKHLAATSVDLVVPHLKKQFQWILLLFLRTPLTCG